MIKSKLAKDFIIQKIDKKVKIFDGEKSILYSFNETGSFIISEIKKELPEEKIIEKIAFKYNLDIKKAKKDFEEFIKELKNKKIII